MDRVRVIGPGAARHLMASHDVILTTPSIHAQARRLYKLYCGTLEAKKPEG